MNEALIFYAVRVFLAVITLCALFGCAMAWLPLFRRWTGPPARIVKHQLLTAISMDGTNFSCGDVLHYNLEDGRLWLMSTTWPNGRYVEGRFFSVTVVPRA